MNSEEITQPNIATELFKGWLAASQPFVEAWGAWSDPARDPFKEQEQAVSKSFDIVAGSLERAMNTEAFAADFAGFMQQLLTRQHQWETAVNPRLDQNLRSMNLPSRDQFSRLFDLVIVQQERFDDLERQNRQLKSELKGVRELLEGLVGAAAPPASQSAAA